MDEDEPTDGGSEKTSLLPAVRRSKLVAFCRRHKIAVGAIIGMLLLIPLLGLLALRNRHAHAQHFTSPIVYPSPQGYGAGNWFVSYEKAHALVANMTLEAMNNITLGIVTTTGCVGMSGAAPSVGFPGFCLHDAGNGVRYTDGVNGYASGIHIGASWNATLAYKRAQFMGAEFKRKGVNVALGPVVGPIGRIAEGGRNWEGFAADPYLDGILGAQTVIGLQESVIASIKHFVANEQETNRNPSIGDSESVLSTSANLDDQTMHELYVWPFQDLVYAGAGSVMCSYNRINNTYGCENSKTLNGILKGELNFQGFCVSDWTGQHSFLESANAGLDMAMPTTAYWNERQLERAVNDGVLNKTRLVDMATRIIASWYQFGQDDGTQPGHGMPINLLLPHNYTEAKDPASKQSLLQQAIEGHVLVKNMRNALPLKQPKVLSIFGYDAVTQASFVPDGQLFPQNWNAIGLQLPQLQGIGSNTPMESPPEVFNGSLFVGGGSGSNTPAYISTPYDAIQARAYDDGTAIFFDFASTDPAVVSSSDACLVFINEYASEAWDRPGLADPDSDHLVNNVASSCNNTIVVIHNAGIRLVDAWVENPNVTAIIFAHLPGQDSGRALAQIFYGDSSPSGRLPYTVAKRASDYGHLQGPCQADGSSSPQCEFTEGPNVDYRSFLARNVTPRYEFGFGLTYSSFNYADLQININATATPDDEISPVYTNGTTNRNSNNADIVVGGLKSLFQIVGTISASVTNTGNVAAEEVAQLYLQIPTTYLNNSNPVTRVLRGFQKHKIEPTDTAKVTFSLRRKDVATWNVIRQGWIVPSGDFQVFVGKSVLDTPLTGSFST